MVKLPRIIIAAAASGSGKTTIATGLMAALSTAGTEVAGFKVGPDFIDPGYHTLATGRPGRNLDAVMCGEELIVPLLLHGAGFGSGATAPRAEVAVIEGVMGLFDGQLGGDGFGSTAHLADLTKTPVVLVVDAAGSSRTAAAAALGLRAFDPRIQIASVVVNRVASARHAAELQAVFDAAGMPVLGFVPRNAGIAAPSRHLGLVPADERAESAATIAAMAEHLGTHVDLQAVLQVARTAADLNAEPWDPARVMRPVSGRPRVAVFAGRAFTFRYAETTELLQAAGCEIVEIDPLTALTLPQDLSGLYIGGGFPEVHAAELSRNTALRRGVAEAVAAGLPTVAECAGQLYLSQHLDGHPMAGVLPASSQMTPRLTLGYRRATTATDTLLASADHDVVGHEFHRTQTVPDATHDPAWAWAGGEDGFSLDPAGSGQPSLHSSYLHLHWASQPKLAQRFAQACADFEAPALQAKKSPPHATTDGIDLSHHGDSDLGTGLIDLAVNVMLPGPPAWLAEQISQTIAELGAYPNADLARQALAALHQVPAEMVLPTAGAAEAFMLIARTLRANNPVVVHPQFTEPEAALRACGHRVQRWLLPLEATVPSLGELPSWADAVFIGNPTNPTGWLHQSEDLLQAGRGGLLVVDEAFMDATDGRESLISAKMANRLVVRSLSKTWGLAGLRVGYVVGDPAWIARLEAAQPSWPLSSPAIAAMVATSSSQALSEAAGRYRELAHERDYLGQALASAGFISLPSVAPFVLVNTSNCGPASVREPLARAGFAVRRAETFPGLGPTWIRIKVPPKAITDRLLVALSKLRSAL